MGGFAVLALFIGVLTLIGLYVLVRQLERSDTPAARPSAGTAARTESTDSAVLVVNQRGQLVHTSALALEWLGLDTDNVNFELVTARVQPVENFYALLENPSQTSFRIADRWVSGSSSFIPDAEGWSAIITLRESTEGSAEAGSTGSQLDVSQAIHVMNRISASVTAGMNVETTLQVVLQTIMNVIPSDGGEICLWDERTQFLTQRGWVGDSMYVITVADTGGGYQSGQGAPGWVARMRQPLLVGTNNRVDAREVLENSPFRSVISAPLQADNGFLGTLTFYSHTTNAYHEGHVAFLEAVTNSVSTAIHNATLYSRQEQRMRDIAQLQELAENASDDNSATSIYQQLNERIVQLLDAEMSGIFLYDKERELLIAQTPFVGINDSIVTRIQIPLPLNSPQRDIWESQPYWVANNLAEEPLVEALGIKPIVEVAGIRNTALIPMTVGGERIGFLAVSNRRGTEGFTPVDIESLRVLATQAGIIVENLRLFARERLIDNELLGLQEMTAALGSLNQEGEFYATINERIARLMRCQMSGILLYDAAARRLVAQPPFFGVAPDVVQSYAIALPNGSVMEELWNEVDVWFSNHVQSDTLVFEAGLDELSEKAGVTRTLFAVMSVGGRRIGVVQVSNPEDDREFGEKETRLLQIFATQAASILENGRLYREVEMRADQADGLRRVSVTASSIMTPEESFTPVLAEIARFMDSAAVFINLIDHNTNTLISYPRYAYGLANVEVQVFDLANKEAPYTIALSGRPFLSNDTFADTRLLSNYRLTTQKYQIRSAVLVPLTIGDRSLGELGVGNRIGRPYDKNDIVLLSTVASQIAAALERLLLYEATGENLRRRMQELDAIARISNELAVTLDLNQVLETIRKEVMGTLQADDASIVLLRPAAQWRVATLPETDRRLGSAVFNTLADIESAASARKNEALIVADYASSDWQAAPADAQSAAAVAIFYSDDVVGVIHAWAVTPNRFDDRAAGFLATIASKAALAFQNASYYQQQLTRGESLRQRVDQLNRIFELGQMLQSSADAESILEAVAYSVQQSVGYDTVLMLLVDDNAGVLRRIAQAGMPLATFELSRNDVTSLEVLGDFLKPEFRMSETYFFPIDRVEEWQMDGSHAFEVNFANSRTLPQGAPDAWRDGDLLVVNISGQGGNLLGMMVLDRPYDNKRPDRGRIEVLEIFAHQAATMVENTRLFLESRRSADQEAQLGNIMRAVAATLDLNDIASAIAKGIRSLVPFNRLTLAVAGNNDTFDYLRVIVEADQDLNVTQETRLTLDGTALGRTYTAQRAYVYNASKTQPRSYSDLRSWHNDGEQATLIVPLIAGGECLGAMHLGSNVADSVTAADIRPLLERIGQLVASSIQNSRLFTQAVNLQVLNRSVVESIQQGIVVLDNSGRIININEFMRTAYGWDDQALRQDLFAYQPDLAEVLSAELRGVLENGQPGERLGFTSTGLNDQLVVRNFYIYALRAGEIVRGAVLLVDDVTERTRLEENIEARANQLAALNEVSTRITSLLEREEIITLAIDEMGWIIPYDTMTIWRRNGSYMVLEGANGFTDARSLLGTRVRIADTTSIQMMVESQRIVTLHDLGGELDLGLPDMEHIRSWLGVPLVNQGHVVGVLMLTKNVPHAYETREEQHVAFAFGSQVAIALANADLFEQTFERTNELGTLLEAAQATSMSRDLNEVFNTVAELMFSALEQEDATILIWHEVEDDLEVEFTVNRSGQVNTRVQKGLRYNLKQYPARAKSLHQRDVIVIVDQPAANNPPQYESELQDLREMGRGARMFVPLVVADRPIGIIQMEQISNDERSLTNQKVRLAKALGAQVAVAIENARLSAETNVRFEELITINSLSQAISSTLKLEDMLPIIQEQVPAVTKAEELYLALYDGENQMITFPLAVSNGKLFYMPPRALNTDEVSYIIKRKQTLRLGADYFAVDELRRSMGIVNGEGDAKSYLGVPLISGNDVLGVLAIRSNTKTRAFNLNDDRILTTVGSQLAAAIQNAKLFERVSTFADDLNDLVKVRTDELEEERDRLDTLYQITSELARTLDMEQLLDRALGMVSKAVGAEDGVILLSDPATDSLYPRAWINPNTVIRSESGAIVSHPAVGFAEWFLMNADEHDHVTMVADLVGQPYWSDDNGSNMRSALAVILENNEDPIGVMVLLSKNVGVFTENHIKLLVPAANQVAASINSADLYQLIRDQAERLGRLLRVEQEEAQKQGAILEGINDGVMLADASGVVVLFNHAAERILEIPRADILNQNVTRLADNISEGTYEWARFVQQLHENIEKKMKFGAYLSERVQLNDYYITTYLTPVSSGEQFLGVLAVFRDVTRDVESERTKNQFITNVSHEFRTPLTPIKGFTDLLLMGAGGNLSDSQTTMVETIKSNVERLTLLVNDVLNISKLDSRDVATSMQMVSLPEILQSVLDQIAGRSVNVKRGYTSSVTVDNAVPRIRADRDKLIQLMANLVDNAFKYTRPGGRIDVAAALDADHRHVLLTVKDTGVGIPDEFKDQAFKRFERYDKHALEMDVAGTGLGLSLVKELASIHNGEVWFDSVLGEGTTFTVRLPIEQPEFMTSVVATVTSPTS